MRSLVPSFLRSFVPSFLAICLTSGSAAASSSRSLSLADQAAAADVVVEGQVDRIDTRMLDDGFTVSLVRVRVSRILRGEVPTGTVSLGLPGAFIDGRWLGALGWEPHLAPGETLLFFGAAVGTEDVQMVGGPQSVFRRVDSRDLGAIVADWDANPIIDPGCSEARMIARPSSERPPSEAAGADRVEPPTVTFVDSPDALGLPWEAFVSEVARCVAGQPESAGSRVAVGGGW